MTRGKQQESAAVSEGARKVACSATYKKIQEKNGFYARHVFVVSYIFYSRYSGYCQPSR